MAKQNIINDDNFSSYEKDGEEIVENAFNKIVPSPKERVGVRFTPEKAIQDAEAAVNVLLGKEGK
ncbi:MAG: hypothetical protein ACR2KX_11120 [Chitinophagaceae bacterium]